MNRLLGSIAVAATTLFLALAPVHAADIALSEDRTYIVLTGEIETSDFDKFVALYNDPESHVTSVMLQDSPGGAFVEAINIGSEIGRLGLSTAAFGYCNSACAFIWAAGKIRILGSGVSMGWHSPSPAVAKADGTTNIATPENSLYNAEEIEALNKSGEEVMRMYMEMTQFPEFIIDIIANTKQPSAVYFDELTMLATGMATAVIDAGG